MFFLAIGNYARNIVVQSVQNFSLYIVHQYVYVVKRQHYFMLLACFYFIKCFFFIITYTELKSVNSKSITSVQYQIRYSYFI